MTTYYYDGSQHLGYKKLGIGIVLDEDELHFNTSEYGHRRCSHEIEAIRKTIEIAIKDNNIEIKVPKTVIDKQKIRRYHHPSRRYMLKGGNK